MGCADPAVRSTWSNPFELMEQNESDVVRRWRQPRRDGGERYPATPSGPPRQEPRRRTAARIPTSCRPRSKRPSRCSAPARAPTRASLGQSSSILLRIGACIPVTCLPDDHDVYGTGVNLAARLTGLAGPGRDRRLRGCPRSAHARARCGHREIWASCYLKHVQEPVRAYRVGPPGPRPVIEPGTAISTPRLRPTIAVSPVCRARRSARIIRVVGEVLADEIIAALVALVGTERHLAPLDHRLSRIATRPSTKSAGI